MTVADLGRMPAAEFAEWQAYIKLEGDIREKADLQRRAQAGSGKRTTRMRGGRR